MLVSTGMLVGLGIIAIAAIAGLGVVIAALHNAPEGYEDGSGFHLLKRRAPGSRIVRTSEHKKSGDLTPLGQAKARR